MDTGQDGGQDTGTPLVDAAAIMGTTPAALRKRLQRGSVPGYKREGQWYVLVDSAHPVGSPRAGHGVGTALARTDDQRAADLAMILDRVAAVYEAQIAAQETALTTKDEALAAQAETIAELRRRAEVAEAGLARRHEAEARAAELLRRRDEQERLNRERMQAAEDGPGATAAPTPDTPSGVPSQGFWARVRRVFGGA